MKVWHISDTHLSFDSNWNPLKPMHERKWAIGVWTYQGYLDKMKAFGTDVIKDDDFVFITGDIVHDMKEDMVGNSIRWLRHNVKGTIIICRGNHDKFWQPGKMRQRVSDLPNLYLIDEGEILTIGPFTVGCFSNHAAKTQDFSFVDGRYLETAIRTVAQANFKNTIPVMMSHYPLNLQAAQAVGKAGIKAYMSGHIHCTAGNDPKAGSDGLNWEWYDFSAAQTDDKSVEGCFFSTGTTDVVLARHGKSFKEIAALSTKESVDPELKPVDELIILCGLPGSGKSTLAKEMEGRGYVRVNQDELGSKRTCIRVAEGALKAGHSVVIDRCNFNKEQRSTWINLAKQFKVKNVRAIWLKVPVETCINRAAARTDHPTIENGEVAERVITSLNRIWETPEISEGIDEIEARVPGQSHNR
jgi:predicted kinase/predicted phosphohydrolase